MTSRARPSSRTRVQKPDEPQVICDNEDCELYQQTQDGDREQEAAEGIVRCEECGQPL